MTRPPEPFQNISTNSFGLGYAFARGLTGPPRNPSITGGSGFSIRPTDSGHRYRAFEGASRFLGIQNGSLQYSSVRYDDLKKHDVVVMDSMYKSPLALQIDLKSRAFWEEVYHGDTVFWVGDRDVDYFETWVQMLSGPQMDKMKFLVAGKR